MSLPIIDPEVDVRLLGAWRSDRRLTLKSWTFPATLSPEKRVRVGRMFGKLVITYDKGRLHSYLNGFRDSKRYEVVEKGRSSVLIRTQPSALDTKLLGRKSASEQGIHFEMKDLYWISVGTNREYFRRVKQRSRPTAVNRLRAASATR